MLLERYGFGTDVELCREKISSGGTISADEVDELLKTENKKSDEDTPTTSEEEIDALLGGTPAENTKD